MKQPKELVNLKKGDKVEVNGESFKVLKIEVKELCHPTYCEAIKNVFLTGSYLLIISQKDMKFQRIIKSGNKEIKIKSIKI